MPKWSERSGMAALFEAIRGGQAGFGEAVRETRKMGYEEYLATKKAMLAPKETPAGKLARAKELAKFRVDIKKTKLSPEERKIVSLFQGGFIGTKPTPGILGREVPEKTTEEKYGKEDLESMLTTYNKLRKTQGLAELEFKKGRLGTGFGFLTPNIQYWNLSLKGKKTTKPERVLRYNPETGELE